MLFNNRLYGQGRGKLKSSDVVKTILDNKTGKYCLIDKKKQNYLTYIFDELYFIVLKYSNKVGDNYINKYVLLTKFGYKTHHILPGENLYLGPELESHKININKGINDFKTITHNYPEIILFKHKTFYIHPNNIYTGLDAGESTIFCNLLEEFGHIIIPYIITQYYKNSLSYLFNFSDTKLTDCLSDVFTNTDILTKKTIFNIKYLHNAHKKLGCNREFSAIYINEPYDKTIIDNLWNDCVNSISRVMYAFNSCFNHCIGTVSLYDIDFTDKNDINIICDEIKNYTYNTYILSDYIPCLKTVLKPPEYKKINGKKSKAQNIDYSTMYLNNVLSSIRSIIDVDNITTVVDLLFDDTYNMESFYKFICDKNSFEQ